MTADFSEGGPDPHSPRRILILYGSETGNAQDVAERIARDVHRFQFKPQILGMDDYPLVTLIDEPLVIFVCSTTGNGVEPQNMTSLWQALLRSDLPDNLFDATEFAVFGLGDSSYERFNWAAKKLQRRLQSLGAREILARGDADDQHSLGVEGALNPWITQLIQVLVDLRPLPLGLNADPIDTSLKPRIRFTLLSYPNFGGSARLPSLLPTNGIDVTLKRNDRMTSLDWFQDVRHIVFEAEQNIPHQPGDVAVIWPENTPEDVDTLLERLAWPIDPDSEWQVAPYDIDWPLPSHFPSVCSARGLLTRYLDISTVPRRSFFDIIRNFTEDQREKEKLDDFCSAEGQDELFSYCNKPRRTILEVLAEFKSIQIPFEWVVDVFPPIRPRRFSIASSEKAYPRNIHLCVAIVRYKTILKAPRKGLCTSWISQLRPGARLRIGLQKGTFVLPKDPSTPVILIGPGTGVAPMRALLQERIHTGAHSNMLYFGCRSLSSDCHFKDEWEDYSVERNLIFRAAGSRDQESKIYVQHLIQQDSGIIANWVAHRGAHVYISGSSNQMPKAVRNALARALSNQEGWDESRALEYVQQMERSGRLAEECWS